MMDRGVAPSSHVTLVHNANEVGGDRYFFFLLAWDDTDISNESAADFSYWKLQMYKL